MAQVASLTQRPCERISAGVRGQCSGRVVPVSSVVVSGSCAKKIPCSRTAPSSLFVKVTDPAGTGTVSGNSPRPTVVPVPCMGTVTSR